MNDDERIDHDLLTILGIAEPDPPPATLRANALFQATPSMQWVSGRRKNRIASNGRYLRFVFGDDFDSDKYDAITGDEWERRCHPEDFTRFKAVYTDAVEKQIPFSGEVRLRRYDGQYRWISVQGAPFVDPVTKRFYGYIGNCYDVHDRRILEIRERDAHLALTNMNADLQTALAAKARFLAIMSHEIRTPLAVVISAMELMRSSQDTDERVGLLESVEENIKHLKVLLNDVIDVARIDQFGVTLTVSEFNVNVTARDCIRIMHPACLEKRCEIVFDSTVENGNCYVRGDEGRYRQILINLLRNAVNYTPTGDKIILELRKQSPMTPSGVPRYVIRVIDHGPGIPENQRGRLFQSFSQLGSVIVRGQEGVGLGLYITEQIVKAFGGNVTYQPAMPHGSIFRVELPLPVSQGAGMLEAVAAEPPAAASSTIRAAANLHVMVVEDNRALQMLIGRLLTRVGVTHCDLTANGQEAVDRARDNSYDLILMDIQMPVMDGFTATRIIRAMPRHRDTIIIRFTASTVREDHDQCRLLGMEDYCLPKPFRESDVRMMIGNVLKKLNVSSHA